MLIAIAQMPMAWTVAENTATILYGLDKAKCLGAEMVVFPEIAVTGYHSRLREVLQRQAIEDALAQVRAACRNIGIAAAVGTPYYPTADDGIIWNAVVAITDTGEELAVCPKYGFAPGEEVIFSRHDTRPVFTFCGKACTAILCREVKDLDRVQAQLSQPADVAFWPSIIGWNPDDPEYISSDEGAQCGESAVVLAHTLGLTLVQANWPGWLDTGVKGLGGSRVITPDGVIAFACPRDTCGMAVVSLAEAGVTPVVPWEAWKKT